MMGGEHATARRTRIAEDRPFILAQAERGTPVGAIARMIGRNPADVAIIVNPPSVAAIERKSAKSRLAPKVKRVPRVKSEPKVRRRKVRCRTPRALTPLARKAIQTIADFYGVTVEEMIGRRGGRALQPIRQEAYSAVYDIRLPNGERRYSSICVGLFFGGRDHTTILLGMRSHAARIAAEREEVAA